LAVSYVDSGAEVGQLPAGDLGGRSRDDPLRLGKELLKAARQRSGGEARGAVAFRDEG